MTQTGPRFAGLDVNGFWCQHHLKITGLIESTVGEGGVVRALRRGSEREVVAEGLTDDASQWRPSRDEYFFADHGLGRTQDRRLTVMTLNASPRRWCLE